MARALREAASRQETDPVQAAEMVGSLEDTLSGHGLASAVGEKKNRRKIKEIRVKRGVRPSYRHCCTVCSIGVGRRPRESEVLHVTGEF